MTSNADRRSPAGRARLGRLVLGLLALAAAIWLGRLAVDWLPAVNAWIEGLGALAPFAFMAVYVLAVIAFVPGTILTLAAGVLFGVIEGTFYVFCAASVGACLAFLIARYVARESVEAWVGERERFSAIDRAVGAEGLKIGFLLRLSPVFPFNLLNYALGLTRMRFADYALACVGMLPGTLLYVYLGSLAGSIVAIASGQSGAGDGAQRWIFFGGLLVTAAVTVAITRVARNALARATAPEPTPSETR